MLTTTVMVLWLCVLVVGQDETKQHPELGKLVMNWAQKLGGELWHFGEMVTRRTMVIESFKETSVVREDGEALLKDINERISNMMKQKVEAVKRIVDVAEQVAKAQKEDDINEDFQFVDMKNLTDTNAETITTTTNAPIDTIDETNEFGRVREVAYETFEDDDFDSFQNDQEMKFDDDLDEEDEKDPQASQTPLIDKTRLPLISRRHFYNIPVNTNYSGVHVPSNVYERATDVLSGIIWSEKLDETFRHNYKLDPTLSWQYFGSSTGFMRQFPAMIWSQEPLDLFDCRTRSWFIEAASSPKDIVILVDRSGSMTGMRREIARHVVYNILDTLGNNDYVNIYTFSNTTDSLVECFDDMLVQANLANVRIMKESMTNFRTEQIANFSLALVTAFELLQSYRTNRSGADCNQAIMLITDGVQYNYKEIFDKYNWANLPYVNVRVFTYLIGREVSDVREIKWMACANRGYYVHLSTYSEVREEVLRYIPVMARPMVLNATVKPKPTWSPVYVDVTDPKLTNWLWINRERNRQRDRFLAYRKNRAFLTPDEHDKKFVYKQKTKPEDFGDVQTYHLMTSVSMPVYDKRPRANITEKIQINEAVWITVTREERVANLLGVAGTDIPIEYIQKLMMPYRLGVNGYAFVVTNNGYILTHPDLRPVYQGILKPAYNRVDMIEVEVPDDDTEPRQFSEEIKELRRRIVMQERGNATIKIKSHIDDMRRVVHGSRHYYFMGIPNTPFTLVVVLPHRYGFNRIEHPVKNDIHRMSLSGNVTRYFMDNWTVHPDWHYCRYVDDRIVFENPEEEFLHFLKRMNSSGWKWSECDRKLVCKVAADAKITAWFSQNITTSTKVDNGAEFIRRFGITVAFLATHSGLTRWQYFPQNIETGVPQHFHLVHNKAIDEVWYKRAVEHNLVEPLTFVYSVPFEIGDENHTLITVSQAIFHETDGRKAPAAVVGYQFYHSALYALFKNITTSCGAISCKRTCESNELHCLMLDDSGYVIVSDNPAETGHFFGRLRPDVMAQMVDENIYKMTRMYDYQGLCAEEQESGNMAPSLATPLVHLVSIGQWMLTLLAFVTHSLVDATGEYGALFYQESDSFMNDSQSVHVIDTETAEQQQSITNTKFNDKEFDQRLLIKKTMPEPCDNELALYSLVKFNEKNGGYNRTAMDCRRPFIVQHVTDSNMILLVVNNLCRENTDRAAHMPDPVKVDYNITLACYKVIYNNFPIRHYMSCINRNANESEIKLCGGSLRIRSSILSHLIFLLSIVVFLY